LTKQSIHVIINCIYCFSIHNTVLSFVYVFYHVITLESDDTMERPSFRSVSSIVTVISTPTVVSLETQAAPASKSKIRNH